MVLQATIDMLVGMKMTAMAAELSNQLQDPSFNELGFVLCYICNNTYRQLK